MSDLLLLLTIMWFYYFVVFALVAFPIWIVFRFAKTYETLFICRNVLKYAFFAAFLLILCVTIKSLTDNICFTGDWAERKKAVYLLMVTILLLVPLYYVWRWISQYDFYDSTHVENLKYFTLYLRSFKDDNKSSIREIQLMYCIDNFFTPFAVGRPSELRSPTGALRLYIGDDWKEKVEEMMSNAPIILLRISDTENFLWEFEQCVLKKYLWKSVFWISDLNAYPTFADIAKAKYGIIFPRINGVKNNSVVYQGNGSFVVKHLSSKKTYSDFFYDYLCNREDLQHNYADFYGGRNLSWWRKLSWEKVPYVKDGMQKWDWTAFYIPEFYILMHRIPNRVLIYLLLIFWDVVFYNLFSATFNINYNELSFSRMLAFVIWLIIRVLFVITTAKCGRRYVWLSEKWESVDYFEKIYKKNNIKAWVYAIVSLLIPVYYMLSFYLNK